jgi:hypothetical protein
MTMERLMRNIELMTYELQEKDYTGAQYRINTIQKLLKKEEII